jgi:hypothetical protein
MDQGRQSVGWPGDRRAAARYAAALRVELWALAGPRALTRAFYTTRDVSLAGFHFYSQERFEAGDKLGFLIVFPGELTGRMTELMGGIAECVRIEDVRGADIDRYGVGAQIEKTTQLVGDR